MELSEKTDGLKSRPPFPAPTSEGYAKSSASLDGEKAKQILDACLSRNVDNLTVLAESVGGFLTDSIRQQACK
jgi:hypothetical protein